MVPVDLAGAVATATASMVAGVAAPPAVASSPPVAPTHLAVAPLVVPLVTAVLTLLTRRWPAVRTAVSLAGGVAYAAAVALLAWLVVLAPGAPGAVAYQSGGWPAPFGVTIVVDGLSAFMLVLAATVGVAALAFAVRSVESDLQDVFFHPLYHVLLLGVSGAFLTGDLFNLFVWFEVVLMATYVFVAFHGGAAQTRAALWLVVLNVVAGALMLVAIGGLYATTGTLNMADMARRLADPAASGVAPGPVVGLSALLFAVFALKAGLVPFQFWVPSAYAAAPLPVTALLAGGAKKVGVYAVVRLYFTVLAGAETSVALPWLDGASPLAFLGPVLLGMAAASIVVGGLGAARGSSLVEVLAYSSVGQVGFIAVPIAVGATVATPAARHLGVLAGLVFALHHALAKGTLFLAAAAVRDATGSDRLSELGGLAGRFPALSAAFLVGGLSLVGIPPLSGFAGKLLAFGVAVRAGSLVAGAVLLLGSLLTIAYVTRAWAVAFWGRRTGAVRGGRDDPVLVGIVVALAAVVVGFGVGFEAVYRFADAAATAAVDTEAYVEVVDPVDPADVDAAGDAGGEHP